MLHDAAREKGIFPVTIWNAPDPCDSYAVKRTKELKLMFEALIQKNKGMLAIEGDYGIGKTFLAKSYAEQYKEIYKGGVTYCSNYWEFQHLIEKWEAGGYPAQRHLAVADELTELIFNPNESYELERFLNRFRRLCGHSRETDVILIGNPVPEELAHSYPILKVPALTDFEAENLIMEGVPAMGVNKLSLLPLIEQIVRTAEGNPRNVVWIRELLRQSGGILPDKLERIPCILGADGEPMNTGDKEYGRIRADVMSVNDRILYELRRNPEKLYQMSGREFERFVAALLQRLGYQVTLTPPTRDGGVDIFAAKKERLGTFLGLIQCKKQRPSSPVGINVLREMVGLLQSKRATFASVVTTSYFSKPAVDFQRQFEHQLTLVDYEKIKELLQLIKESRPS